MFQSATLKLTSWYLLILMSISLVFSVAIYNIATSEIDNRLELMQTSLRENSELAPRANFDWQGSRTDQSNQAALNLLIGLIYANVSIFIIGGVCSYLLARRALRPIEEAHEAQSRFTSDASHELRTPLATMKTEMEVILRDQSATKQELKETLKSNLEEVEKLSRLARMLLDLSRLEHNKLERTSVNLHQTTLDTLPRFGELAGRVQISAPKQSLIAHANQAAAEELITILVDNALKYSPADSKVEISLSRSNHKVGFKISNSGPGIDAATLPHIFDRFYRSDTSRTGGGKTGYGLGLSLAKKIVELSDGELSATSATGGITTFSVLLPTVKRIQAKNQNQSVK